jgi:hypothetical protein
MFKKKNLLILIGRNAVLSAISLSIAIFTIFFLMRQINNLSDSLALDRSLEASTKNRAELSEIIKKDAQIIGTNYHKIEESFLSSDNIQKFINSLDKLALEKSISQVYRFDNPATSEIHTPFSISVISYSNVLTSDISSFSNYLTEFEKLPYFSSIEEFTISSQDKSGWIGPSIISYKAKLYTKTAQ